MLMVINTSNQLLNFSFFFLAKMKFFCSFFHSTIINSSKHLQQVFSLENLEIIWLGESQLTKVGYYYMASYWVSNGFLHAIIGVGFGCWWGR
jgi:hypothetical protein